jgi:hypothetical protein
LIHTIEFNQLSTVLLDFVDNEEGFLYLRMAGAETAVNAIWAYLSAREGRGKKWGSQVRIPLAGRSPQYVAAAKHITYRTLRTRLLSGMVDLALIHPRLTVAEDSQRGFYLLTYEEEMPLGFFERLNQALSIPLKPEWATWLWQQGQQPQSFLILDQKAEWEGGQRVEKTILARASQLPITRLNSLGKVSCYAVLCSGRYKDAWLEIIRRQLALSIPLQKMPHLGDSYRYQNDPWAVYPYPEGWALYKGDDQLISASSLDYLLTEAKEHLGTYFTLEEKQQ